MEGEGTKAVTFEDVKGKTTFEDADLTAIKAEADKEFEAEHKPKETEEEAPKKEEAAPKEDTGDKEEEAPKETPEEKAAKEAEAKKKEDERILQAKDEDLKPEDKTRKAELLKAQVEEDVKATAKEYEITEDEARKSIEHIQKIREKYKDDPKGLAKANYFIQRLQSKQAEELKALKSAPKEPPVELNVENVIKLVDKGAIKHNGKAVTREEVIEAYRKEYADITETVDDETVLKMAAKEYITNFQNKRKEEMATMAAKAKEKRATLANSLSEADKAYLPDIKPIIDNLPDHAILGEGFSIEDTIAWAKGKKFDTAVKEAEERGYRRGKEEARILGEKKKPSEGGSAPKTKTRTLSEAEKRRALDMFDGQPISDDEKFKLYAEIEEDRKKKKE